jgi:hypothetical protein
MMTHRVVRPAARKEEWTRPERKRLEAGAAESSHGGAPDGGGGNQAS